MIRIAKLFIIILVSCFVQIVSAQSICESILAGLKSKWFSRYSMSLFGIGASSGHSFSSKVFIPREGVGGLIYLQAKKIDKKNPPALLMSVLKFPTFFARYQMFAQGETLIIPEVSRLNPLMTNGVQFEDMPIYIPQYYDEEFFDFQIERDRIPLGSTGDAFFHDRMEEHMMGAMIMPEWILSRYHNYNKFDQAFFELPRVKNASASLKSVLAYYRGLVSSPGRLWDVITNTFGFQVYMFIPAEVKAVVRDDIQRFFDTLRLSANLLTPGPTSRLRLALRDQGHNTEISEELLNDISELERRFAVARVSDEEILNEVLNLIHQLNQTPLEDLKKIWNSQN